MTLEQPQKSVDPVEELKAAMFYAGREASSASEKLLLPASLEQVEEMKELIKNIKSDLAKYEMGLAEVEKILKETSSS